MKLRPVHPRVLPRSVDKLARTEYRPCGHVGVPAQVLRACANRKCIRKQTGTECSIIRVVLEALRCEGASPCPQCHHTSLSPFGSSSAPCYPNARPITRSAAIALASPTG